MDDNTLRAVVFALLQGAGMLAVAPLLRGTIKKMKAAMQTRQGPPLLQGYYDLAKLLRKETVRSDTASWVYIAGPRLYFAAALAATTLVPVIGAIAPLEGAGGILGLVGILALGRFALAAAALDTGSPFGGKVFPGGWISTLYIGLPWLWCAGVVPSNPTRCPATW